MIRNVHTRTIPVEPGRAGEILDRLLDPRTTVWPRFRWPMLKLDNGFELGSDGGHGPIHYAVSDYRPGRRIEFRFPVDDIFDGTHALEIHDGLQPGTTLVRHTLIARPKTVRARLAWSLAIRWMHDALLEDLLDKPPPSWVRHPRGRRACPPGSACSAAARPSEP